MIKAIVRLEWRLRARRDQFRPLLSCYSTCLLLDCCALYIRLITSRDCIFLPPLPGRSGRFLSAATEFIWLQQWLLPFLLAPVLVANAFTGEKASGLLPLLFTTPVSSGQLILGKFLGRVGPLVMLGLAHWPFWGLFAGLVGLDPLSAGILAGASVLPILAAGSASLLASAWCAKTADAVTILYALFGVGILGTWVLDAASFSLGPAWNMVVESGLAPFGPHYLLESIGDDAVRLPELARRALVALAAWGSVVAGCLGLACRRVRSVSTAQPEIRQSQAALRRPAVDDEPIRWKE